MFYSALLLTGVNLLLRLAGTTFQVYLSGRIGAAGIGLLQLVLSVGNLSLVAGIAGVRTSAMYLTAEELGKRRPGNVRWILSGCFLYSFLCCLFVGAVLYLLSPVIARNWIGDIRTVASLRTFAMFLPCVGLCSVMSGYFTAAGRIGTLSAVEVIEQGLSMGVTIGLLHFWSGSDPGRACQSVILGSSVAACFTLVCLILIRCRETPPLSAPIPVRQRLLAAALPLAGADIVKAGISTLENLMVPKRLALHPGTAEPLAAFGCITGMVFPILMFPACILFGLSELLIPELARCDAAGNRDRISYLVRKSLWISMLYGLLLGGLEFVLADFLCMRLYRNAQAGVFLRLYSLLIPMLYCDCITDAMTKGLGQQKVCVQYNILTSALDVAFLFALLPRWGMAGYFLSFLLTHLLNFFLSLRRLLKITGIQLSFSVPVLAISAALVSAWGASQFPHPVTAVLAFCALLGSLLCLLGITGKEDLLWMRNLLRRRGKTVS